MRSIKLKLVFWIEQLDRTIFVTLLLLMGFGLVQVYSASYIYATERYDSGLYFFIRQTGFALAGFVVLLTAAFFPPKLLKKLGWMVWLLGVVGVVATFIPGLGHSAGGAARWIALPYNFRFEPSELIKVGLPLLLANLLSDPKYFSPLTEKGAPWKWSAVWRLFILIAP